MCLDSKLHEILKLGDTAQGLYEGHFDLAWCFYPMAYWYLSWVAQTLCCYDSQKGVGDFEAVGCCFEATSIGLGHASRVLAVSIVVSSIVVGRCEALKFHAR